MQGYNTVNGYNFSNSPDFSFTTTQQTPPRTPQAQQAQLYHRPAGARPVAGPPHFPNENQPLSRLPQPPQGYHTPLTARSIPNQESRYQPYPTPSSVPRRPVAQAVPSDAPYAPGGAAYPNQPVSRHNAPQEYRTVLQAGPGFEDVPTHTGPRLQGLGGAPPQLPGVVGGSLNEWDAHQDVFGGKVAAGTVASSDGRAPVRVAAQPVPPPLPAPLHSDIPAAPSTDGRTVIASVQHPTALSITRATHSSHDDDHCTGKTKAVAAAGPVSGAVTSAADVATAPSGKVPAAKPKGKGSKKGANRRNQGTSDTEVDALTAEQKADAAIASRGLSEDQKLALVEYVTDPDRWPKFKIEQAQHWQKLAKDFKKSVTTVENYWCDHAWEKYKLCRENLVKHTGGGDGDEDWFPDSATDPGSGDEDAPPGDKRKVLRAKLTTNKFSRATLVKFLRGPIYKCIHKVARKDTSVERKRPFDSTSAISDTEETKDRIRNKRKKHSGAGDEDKDAGPFSEALLFMKERASGQAKLKAREIELAERRERREQAEAEQRQAHLAAQTTLKQRELRLEERKVALAMAGSANPVIAVEGVRMLEALAAEEKKAP
ncbi:hypothetical protein C8Q80DRAFT_1273022 [Daedaleopsis nitida]|nr:hypothetical protein C8Q80DRAFT_1273022 [Daedaleopsis nitida]